MSSTPVAAPILLPAFALFLSGASACGGGDGRDNLTQPDQDASDIMVPNTGTLVVIDRETGSTFNLRGEAFLGPLADEGLELEQLPGVNMFWFAWSIYFPGSEVWGRTETVRQATLPADKTGSTACGGGADCIPSLPNTGPPSGALAWTTKDAGDASYLRDTDLVLGTFIGRKPRAYPHNVLWWHEIANDQVDGVSYSVTFCPLTGSGVVWGGGGNPPSFGVSGNLFNSNLVMYDHASDSLWPQLWGGGVSGQRSGDWLTMLPATETTWAQWKEIHPETLVLSDDTGFSRDYQSYPYGNYRTDDSTTFRTTNPLPDPMYANKTMTFGLFDRPSGAARAYVHTDLASVAGARAAVNDSFGGEPVVVVYDEATQLAIAFVAEDGQGNPLTFDVAAFTP
ncbi:MAG: DUF3179 domain-containing (seleno)protein [Myxococcota bacterium]